MCLIYVAWRRHARHRLVVAANRDEYHARPAASAYWWDDAPGVLAGRDLEAGGTWMGITAGGRFAALTNYRGASPRRAHTPSRGALVTGFLTGDASAPEHLGRVMEAGQRYNGFSLLAMDGETLAFASNRSRGVARLGPGVYGLANHLLDTPWPKVTDGKTALERLLDAPDVGVEDLFGLLSVGDSRHVDGLRADVGSDPGPMQWRASRFILGRDYGTRASTVVLLDAQGAGVFVERSFDSSGTTLGDAAFELRPSGAPRETAGDAGLAGAGVPG